MGTIRIQTAAGDERLLPLFALTVIGRAPALSWSLAPPLLSAEEPSIPAVWLTLRWDAERATWTCDTRGATDHLGTSGTVLTSDQALAKGHRLVGPRVSATVVDVGPPEPLLVRPRDQSFLRGRDLDGLVEEMADGWWAVGWAAPLGEGDVFSVEGIVYRFHLGAPVPPTVEEGIDLGSGAWHGEIDLQARGCPVLRLTSGRRRVDVRHEGVKLLAAYVQAREEDRDGGWLLSHQLKRRYHDRYGGEWSNARDFPGLRRRLREALEAEGVRRTQLLFEGTRQQGADTRMRVGFGPDRLRLRGAD